jgi:hypothetical protein
MTISSQGSARISLLWLLLGCAFALLGCPKNPKTWTPQPPYGTTAGTKDFDLSSPDRDPNGAPDNPRWAPQVQPSRNLPPLSGSDCAKNSQPYQATCTDQSKSLVEDQGTGITGALCTLFGDPSSLNGHADWAVASAQGTIGWLNFAADWDYNLMLLPDHEYGLTVNNNSLSSDGERYIEVEFDSREFDGRFRTGWWQDFARLASEGTSSGDYSGIVNHVHAGPGLPYGVVYGIFGIDCEHGCRSEFHPAYAVAIELDESKQSNTWAIFARNWGDEGFCSHLDHELDLTSTAQAIHLVLPYHSSAGPVVKSEDVASSIAKTSQCPTYKFLPDRGEEVTIPLPAAAEHALTEVVVQFTWPDTASPVEHNLVTKERHAEMLATRKSEAQTARPSESSEEHMDRLFRYFSQGRGLPEAGFRTNVLPKFSANTATATQTSPTLKAFEQRNTPLSCPLPQAASAATPASAKMSTGPRKLSPLPVHSAKEVWDRATVNYFCAAYEASGKKLPPGEPPDLAQKLDKICSDKRLKP